MSGNDREHFNSIRHLRTIGDLTRHEVQQLIESAVSLKSRKTTPNLSEPIIALLFQKPSLRTRVSFEVAIREIGGSAIYLSPDEVGLGKREPPSDVAKVLSRYVHAIVARTFSHEIVQQLADCGTIPVINALSDWEHPCQALGDLLTIHEKRGRFKGLNLAYIGDTNNVARSLLMATSMVGMNFRIACPRGYEPDDDLLQQGRHLAALSGAAIMYDPDPNVVVQEADVIYTDVWTSMGQESESDIRRSAFAKYQVNTKLLSMARDDVLFMHPLPAHHGEEISSGLLDNPHSVVFDQAENRLHIQKAILVKLLSHG
ncbi:MAG: ornithine carbamoyltransferase [Chloroflexota bacterium]|nr:ornithine carbamoyltransferase [Chloroflexota bacterium]